MKSLFANEEIILPSWLKILMETIDSETIQKLSENQESVSYTHLTLPTTSRG